MSVSDFLEKTRQIILRKWQSLNRFAGSQAVEVIEWEYEELQHIFALLVLGSFIGLPSPPLQVTLDLVPDMEQDLHLMLGKIDTASGPLSELFSLLNVG